MKWFRDNYVNDWFAVAFLFIFSLFYLVRAFNDGYPRLESLAFFCVLAHCGLFRLDIIERKASGKWCQNDD